MGEMVWVLKVEALSMRAYVLVYTNHFFSFPFLLASMASLVADVGVNVHLKCPELFVRCYSLRFTWATCLLASSVSVCVKETKFKYKKVIALSHNQRENSIVFHFFFFSVFTLMDGYVHPMETA